MSRHLTDLHLGSSTAPGFAAGDVIVLTGDRDGPVIRHLVLDRKEQALAALQQLVELYGQRNVYVEIHRHRRRDDARINRYLIDLAEHLRLPLLASNAPVFAVHPDRMLADAFSVLPAMSIDERLAADYSIQGASTGPHPMSLWRQRTRSKILRTRDLHIMPPGMPIQIGGLVICRQRPRHSQGSLLHLARRRDWHRESLRAAEDL